MEPAQTDEIHRLAPESQSAELRSWMKLVGAGVTIGHFSGFDEGNRFLVVTANDSDAIAALSTVGLAPADIGAPVVIAFDGGDVTKPVIVGRLQSASRPPSPGDAVAQGSVPQRLVLSAERDLELRCGEASIVLTRAGKVLIRGTYVLSRSRGANRIKGAYVDIN